MTKKSKVSRGGRKTQTSRKAPTTKRVSTKPKTSTVTRKTTGSPSKGRTMTHDRQVTVGKNAPPFTLVSDAGEKVSLSNFKGKKVVLYFYPKDDTPGCTKEACAFRDGIDEIRDSGAVVLGISPDSAESHRKFSKKYDLNFPLLSDVDKQVVQAYGVWKEKSLYGRTFMGVERTTFLIDEQGKIGEIFSKVNVDGHLDEVLSELELMSS